MGYVMTLATFGELVQYPLRVWGGMACKARRYGLMLVLVAKYAGKIVVLGRILGQKIQGFLMTGTAVMRRGVLGILHHQRHMDGMARHTGLEIHIIGMLFVALRAVRNLAVGRMTFVAGEVRVGAGMGLDFVTLLLVAGETRTGQLTFQCQHQRRMGVCVATSAILQLIMSVSAVAHAAFRHGAGPFGRMFHMTIHAAHLGLVFLPLGRNGCRLLGMTMNALRIEQRRNLCRRPGLPSGLGRNSGFALFGSRRTNGCPLLTSKNEHQDDQTKNTNDTTSEFSRRQPPE